MTVPLAFFNTQGMKQIIISKPQEAAPPQQPEHKKVQQIPPKKKEIEYKKKKSAMKNVRFSLETTNTNEKNQGWEAHWPGE